MQMIYFVLREKSCLTKTFYFQLVLLLPLMGRVSRLTGRGFDNQIQRRVSMVYLQIAAWLIVCSYQLIMLLEDGESGPIDHVWVDILSMKTPLGVVRLPLMATVIAPLLFLPQSNADVEILLSVLRKVHSSHADTINASCTAISTLTAAAI